MKVQWVSIFILILDYLMLSCGGFPFTMISDSSRRRRRLPVYLAILLLPPRFVVE